MKDVREIFFRGKRTDNGEWVEGFYYKMNETTYAFAEDYERNPVPTHCYILFEQMTDWGMKNKLYQAEVVLETVCQYTGLTDKDGRKIFDGDIVRVIDNSSERYVGIGNVSFEEGAWYINGGLQERIYWLDDFIDYEFEVIGNVFDNPELLDNGGGPE